MRTYLEIGIIYLVIGMIIGGLIGYRVADTMLQNKAVRDGRAEWSHDETGAPQFQWLK